MYICTSMWATTVGPLINNNNAFCLYKQKRYMCSFSNKQGIQPQMVTRDACWDTVKLGSWVYRHVLGCPTVIGSGLGNTIPIMSGCCSVNKTYPTEPYIIHPFRLASFPWERDTFNPLKKIGQLQPCGTDVLQRQSHHSVKMTQATRKMVILHNISLFIGRQICFCFLVFFWRLHYISWFNYSLISTQPEFWCE